jgi:hypothetical protein
VLTSTPTRLPGTPEARLARPELTPQAVRISPTAADSRDPPTCGRLGQDAAAHVAPIECNFRTKRELIDAGLPYFAGPGERGGVSVFYRDGDTVLHPYSGYLSVVDLLCGNDQYLDLTALADRPRTSSCGTMTGTLATRNGWQLQGWP